MLESITGFIKTLPHWLAVTAEVLIVIVLAMTAFTFLAGLWVGIRIIGRRSEQIQSVELWPPRIVFRNNE